MNISFKFHNYMLIYLEVLYSGLEKNKMFTKEKKGSNDLIH